MLRDIQLKIEKREYEFSRHAFDQTILRRITLTELREAISNGVIIEDYPDDKYGPSCLIFGVTRINRPLHIQCSYPSRLLVKIITRYEPDPAQWIDYKRRRSSNE